MTFGYVLVPSDFIILINEQYIKVFIDYSRLDCHMFYLIIMSIHNRFATRVTWLVPHVELEIPTLPE
jgi:hypothetical protein